MNPKRWQIISILIIGVVAVSCSAIFVRLTMEAAGGLGGLGFSLFIAASRLTLAAIILLPTWRRVGNDNTEVNHSAYYYAGGAGVCLALHFAVWITSLSFTSIAASTALVTTNPVWVALFSWLWWKEKPGWVTIIGIIIALAGGITIGLGDQSVNSVATNPLLGNILALLGAMLVSLYLLLGREAQSQGLGITMYIAIAYSMAALILLPLPGLFGVSYFGYPSLVYVYILLMAIFPQLVGHTSFNWTLKWLSPTIVTLAILLEPIGSSFLGFVIFQEIPSPLVMVGGVVLLLGVAIAILGSKKVVSEN